MIESFYHAFHGIKVGLVQERNLRIHFMAALVVFVSAWWLKVDFSSLALLALAIGLVLTTEFINTALEHLVNITADEQYHEFARYAKDTSAAAVLCASVMAAIVGAGVLGPKIMVLLRLSNH